LTAAGTVNYTPVGFVSAMFRQWRGSLKFKFKLVKTEYHSGRISVAFFPTDAFASYVGNAAYVNRMIVDVRDTTEFEVVVPFISGSPWKSWESRTGILQIAVVDPLIAPPTVSSTVTILMEMAGGDDMEFSIPKPFVLTPSSIAPQSALGNDSSLFQTTIGSSSVQATPTLMSATSVGDKVSSFRAYLKRFYPIYVANTYSTDVPTNYQTLNILPDAILGVDPTVNDNVFMADSYSVIASCYGMVRGGVRLRDVISLGAFTADTTDASFPVNMCSLVTAFHAPTPIGASAEALSGGTGVGAAPQNIHTTRQQLSLNNTLTLEVPQYSPTYAKCKSDIICYQGDSAYKKYNGVTSSATFRGYIGITLPTVLYDNRVINRTEKAYSIHNLFRSLADDADMQVFISVPPMVQKSTNVQVALL